MPPVEEPQNIDQLVTFFNEQLSALDAQQAKLANRVNELQPIVFAPGGDHAAEKTEYDACQAALTELRKARQLLLNKTAAQLAELGQLQAIKTEMEAINADLNAAMSGLQANVEGARDIADAVETVTKVIGAVGRLL